MNNAKSFVRSVLIGVSGLVAATLVVGGMGEAAECKSRGDLDVRYCDSDGDLLADTPTSPGEWLDPGTIIFAYAPTEDPSVYEGAFSELMDFIAKKTGKRVRWYSAENYAAQVEAMRSGRLHVAGFASGAAAFAVNLAGFHPQAIMCDKNGVFGYTLQLITHKSTNIREVKDIKGRKVAHVTPTSNSGHQAPVALFKDMGVVPGKDYEIVFSGKHDNSIMGVANKDYDAAPIASTVMVRMAARKLLNLDDIRIVWESPPFPSTGYGVAHNLKPELQEKIREAFLAFDWTGTRLAKEFKDVSKYCPVSYKEAWKPVRLIQKENNVVYNTEALAKEK